MAIEAQEVQKELTEFKGTMGDKLGEHDRKIEKLEDRIVASEKEMLIVKRSIEEFDKSIGRFTANLDNLTNKMSNVDTERAQRLVIRERDLEENAKKDRTRAILVTAIASPVATIAITWVLRIAFMAMTMK